MRLVATSDLHGWLPPVEPCDLLLIAGDICPLIDHGITFQRRWIKDKFGPWLGDRDLVEADRIVWIAGNHDFALELGRDRCLETAVPRATYLQDELTEIAGLKIWGSPWSREIGGWAFGLPESAPPGEPSLERAYARIPQAADVVLVHGPPRGHRDLTVGGQRVGSEALLRRLCEVKPQLVVCGHIHEGFGQHPTPWDGLIANVSLVDVAYQPAHKPVVFDL